MVSRGDRVLVGLSGGPDSVCLLTLLNRLKPQYDITLFAAYIDHGLRPHETPDEIDFCRELCASQGVPFTHRRIDVTALARKQRLNKHEAARELRYKAFEEIAQDVHAHKTALGHNADDQTETILMRLFRGTGPSGLSGIPPVRRNLIRPLIEIERRDIERFLEKEGIGFVVDSSNRRTDYFRNKIRHLILPTIKGINKEVVKTMTRTADIFREEERYFDIQVTKTLMRLISRKSDTSIELFLRPLETMDRVLLRRVLRRAIDETRSLRGIEFIHIEEILDLISYGNSGDRIYLPGQMRAIKGYSVLTITAEQPAKLTLTAITGPGEIIVRECSFSLYSEILPLDALEGLGDGKRIALVDADKATFPLTLRPRKPGDFFYPLGFGKRKKIQDYFVDEKVPRDERDAVPLLVRDKEIVWVVGHRVDERYRVDKSTRRVLKCTVQPLKF